MDKEKFIASGLLQQYALGLIDPEEEQDIEQLLDAHPELQEEVRRLQTGIHQYAMQQGIPPHPSRLEQQASNAIPESAAPEKTSAPAPRRPAPKPNPAILAAFAGILILWYFQSNRTRNTIDYLRTELQQCAQEQNQLRQTQLLYAQLTDPNVRPVTLGPTGLSPEALSVAFWNPAAGKAYINPSGLPAPPKDCQYQVWADVNGEMINLGLIDPSSEQIQPIAFIENAESLNITIEPLGGSKHPTVAKLLVSGRI